MTPEILKRGSKWNVSIANFSRQGQATGSISLSYPRRTRVGPKTFTGEQKYKVRLPSSFYSKVKLNPATIETMVKFSPLPQIISPVSINKIVKMKTPVKVHFGKTDHTINLEIERDKDFFDAERVTRELMSAAVTETLLAGGIAGAGETLGVSLAAAVVAYIAIEAIQEILNAIFNAMDDDRIGTGTVSFTAPEFTEKSVPMPPVGVPSGWRGQQGIIEKIYVGSGGDSGEYELMFGFIRT